MSTFTMTIHPCFTQASSWVFYHSHFDLLSEELALEEAIGLLRDRQCNE